jgi:CRISPR/Cas system-associated protein endoribonuclease Cas2
MMTFCSDLTIRFYTRMGISLGCASIEGSLNRDARYCISEEATARHPRRLLSILPMDRQVRLMKITDRQFGEMEVYYGKNKVPVENAPAQLLLF